MAGQHDTASWVQQSALERFHINKSSFRESDEAAWLNPEGPGRGKIERFVRSAHGDRETALKLLIDCLKWRQEFQDSIGSNANDQDTGPAVHNFFKFEDDSTETPVCVCICQHARLDANGSNSMLKKRIVDVLGSLFDESIGHPEGKLTLIFDFVGASAEDMDLSIFEFLAKCFRCYYPGMLGVTIGLELPWHMTSVWATIRYFLIKEGPMYFVKTTVEGLGGHVSELTAERIVKRFVRNYKNNSKSILRGSGSPKKDKDKDASPSTPRRVSFANSVEERSKPTAAVKLFPAKELLFNAETDEDPLSTTLFIANISENRIMFKIKTTSPTNYRVRPNSGLCEAGSSVEISIKRRDASRLPFRDRFLVVVSDASEILVDEGAAASSIQKVISDYMSSVSRSKHSEYRLQTIYLNNEVEFKETSPWDNSANSPGPKSFESVLESSLDAGRPDTVSNVPEGKGSLASLLQAMVLLLLGMFIGVLVEDVLQLDFLV
eukprot:m.10969 g.10969  ORF g.10969 m.10969 type:complete len:492 (+) comp4355_c0_seq2:180-1655(+)